MKRAVWAWVWVQIAKGMWREWHMTPFQRVSRTISRDYVEEIRKQLNAPIAWHIDNRV